MQTDSNSSNYPHFGGGSESGDKDFAKRSNLLKFEAMMLFTQIKNQLGSSRWFFFDEARRQGFSLQLSQNISPYRASLHFRYVHRGVLYDAYLEREAHVGVIGENLWTLSFPGIEGKTQALLLREHLSPLRAKGYDIPNGEEYLDRQMNFSLGLYASCLMRVDAHFPTTSKPFDAFCMVMDHLEQYETRQPIDFHALERESMTDEEETPEMMTGDWQTWK